jgi:hypothetical protein
LNSNKTDIIRDIFSAVSKQRQNSKTWSLTLREGCRLRFFENRVLRRIFGPKRDEVTGEWRRLHNKEVYALDATPKIRVIKPRKLRWAGHVARKGKRRAAYRGLMGET